jgi:hypothetical protein
MKFLTFLLVLSATLAAHAQRLPQYYVRELTAISTNIAGNDSTNAMAYDNANGAANPAAIQLPGDVSDVDIIVSFYCPTTALAAVSFVIGTGPSADLIGNATGLGQQGVFIVPASSANNSNVVAVFKWSNQPTNGASQLSLTDTMQGVRSIPPLMPYLRINGITNGNSATVGYPRVFAGFRSLP